MKKKISFLLFVILAVFYADKSFCQKKDSTWTGILKGVVWDSAHNTVLRSATLAVYEVKNKELIGYTLANNWRVFF